MKIDWYFIGGIVLFVIAHSLFDYTIPLPPIKRIALTTGVICLIWGCKLFWEMGKRNNEEDEWNQ